MHQNTPNNALAEAWHRAKPAKQKQSSATRPAQQSSGELIDVKGLAELMDCSERKVHDIRHEPWFPEALQLSPRCLRWVRSEVLEAIANRAPRVQAQREPAQLVVARSRKEATNA